MKTNSKYLGLVTKKFNDFFLVDLKNQQYSGNSQKFLCKVKKSINFKDQLIYVGDEVAIEKIDFKSKRAVITSLKKRKNLLSRPSVANISNIYVTFSVEEPELNLSQVNRFLISAESMRVEVSLVLTKCDLISDKRKSFLLDKFGNWGYQAITLNLEKSNNFNNLKVEKLGEMDTELFKEWFQAFSQSAGITLHIENLYGDNSHHKVESCFKGLARSLRAALEIDPKNKKVVPSTKGSL